MAQLPRLDWMHPPEHCHERNQEHHHRRIHWERAPLRRAQPMNTGAEAVETAIKCARRWGHRVKGIADGKQEILVARGNFHGRTSTIISFSTEADYRDGFGPLSAGFAHFDFGDMQSVRD